MVKPLALTMGEPAGIGGELSLLAWREAKHGNVPTFFVIDDARRLARLSERLGWQVAVREIQAPEQAAEVFPDALPVWPLAVDEDVTLGKPDAATASAVIASIEHAVAAVRTERAGAVVTNPIQKSVLAAAGFRHPGHTEFLAALDEAPHAPVMMLAIDELKVVPVTIHLPLRKVADELTTAAIVHCVTVTAAALTRDFGIASPRIAVSGLNPHAGEGGLLGREEQSVIEPAIAALTEQGYQVAGPFPADSLFHETARHGYDVAICMYHDQALIPLKTLDYHNGVNVTLGLSFIRTSPDHGTALDIAGRGTADPRSLLAALRTAARMAEQRSL